jgi:hypothetical protein
MPEPGIPVRQFGHAGITYTDHFYLFFYFTFNNLCINGAPGGTRTHDHRLRRPVLYPAELRAHWLRPRKHSWLCGRNQLYIRGSETEGVKPSRAGRGRC